MTQENNKNRTTCAAQVAVQFQEASVTCLRGKCAVFTEYDSNRSVFARVFLKSAINPFEVVVACLFAAYTEALLVCYYLFSLRLGFS